MLFFSSGVAAGLFAAILGFALLRLRHAAAASKAATKAIAVAPAGSSRRKAAITPAPGTVRASLVSIPDSGNLDDDKYSALIHKAKDAILTTDPSGKVDFLNRSAQTLFGYSLADAEGKPIEALLPRRVEATKAADGRAATVRAETVGRRKDGTEFPIELSLSKWQTSGGSVSSIIVRDASERHRAEAFLRKSEANFRALIEKLPLGVLVHRNGIVIYVNDALRDLLALKNGSSIGAPLADLYIPAVEPEVVPGSSLPPRHRDSALRRADGGRVPVQATSLAIAFDGTPATVLIVKDVSEERAHHAQMIFADRMASIGTLAAGVAHEVNNPLAYVLANLEFLKNEMVAAAKRRPDFEKRLIDWTSILAETREGVERVRRIAKDLKVLSRADDVQSSRMSLENAIQTSLHLASTQLQSRARVQMNIDSSLQVMANEPRLLQVFLNLLVNAAQAMPDRPLNDNLVQISAEQDGAWVTVRVRDNGSGIPADARARIFEPFFTTKEVGVGTGLGLSISLDIIRSLGGDLEVDSEAGVGSEFRIRLPAAMVMPIAAVA